MKQDFKLEEKLEWLQCGITEFNSLYQHWRTVLLVPTTNRLLKLQDELNYEKFIHISTRVKKNLVETRQLIHVNLFK